LGHYNAVRQAKEISCHLTMGINSDEETTILKAHPVLSNQERCNLFKQLKWVDAVIGDTP